MSSSGGGTGTPVSAASSTAYEQQPFFTAVWKWDSSANAYVDYTNEARSSGGTTFTMFDDAADSWYLGSESRFDLAFFDLAITGTLGALTYKYYNGSFTTFVPANAYDFTFSSAEGFYNLVGWALHAFSATSPHVGTPPDTRARYWVEITVASVTTAPTVN